MRLVPEPGIGDDSLVIVFEGAGFDLYFSCAVYLTGMGQDNAVGQDGQKKGAQDDEMTMAFHSFALQ
jgi:hypothetical protein